MSVEHPTFTTLNNIAARMKDVGVGDQASGHGLSEGFWRKPISGLADNGWAFRGS
jgi:hypothetical protein